MDDAFKRLDKEFNVSYHATFWEEAKLSLENDELDNAFRQAADTGSSAGFAMSNFNSTGLEDAFLDDAFKDAANQFETAYQPEFWNEFLAKEDQLSMDEAYQDAAKNVKANYHPSYWTNADNALQKEGLHYEYQTAYWREAKELLDKSDRNRFFAKWAGVAAILLLLSTLGLDVGQEKLPLEQIRFARNKSVNQHDVNYADLANRNTVVTVVNSENNSVQPNINLSQEELSIINSASQSHTEKISSQEAPNMLTENNVQEKIEKDILVDENNDIDLNEISLNDLELVTTAEKENFTTINPQEIDETKRSKEEIDYLMQTKLLSDKSKSVLSTIEYQKRPGLYYHNLGIVAGMGLGKGYGLTESFNLPRAYGGLEYTTNGTGAFRKFEFGGSLLVHGLKDDGIVHERRTVKHLENTDSTSSWTKLKINDLVYLNANLIMTYALTRKHRVRFGVGVDRLIGVRSNMAYFIDEAADETDLQKNIRTVNNNWGVQNGIRKSDMKFTLGYEYRLNNQLSVQSNFNFGLLDRTDNEFYNQNPTFDNEMNATIGIRYNFFTKL